jgi:uncharacterized small protein (DUF1192 family)
LNTSFRDPKETKERIEVFKKLRTQLEKIKGELFNSQSDQSINPKLTPFKYDPSKYLEKMLNLFRIINEVDSNNNIALLRNEHEKTKSQLEKVRAERKKANHELSQLNLEMQDTKNKN